VLAALEPAVAATASRALTAKLDDLGSSAFRADLASLKPSDIFGDALVVDLLFDREHLWLTEISTKVDSAKAGSFSAKLTFSAFNVPVTVSAPPSDQVQEGNLSLP